MTGNDSAQRRLAGWVALAALNCALVIPVLNSLWPAPHDFGDCYTGAYIYLHHPRQMLYDVHLQMETEKHLFNIPDAQLAKRFLPWNHLPYELLLYLPLAALPYGVAFFTWNVISVALLAFTAWLLADLLPIKYDGKTIFFIALAFFPVTDCFLSGQDTMVTLALFAICLWCLRNKRDALAGVALGLCLFKFQLVLPIIGVMLLRRAWRLIAGFLSCGVALTIISTIMVGYAGMKGFVHMLLTGESGAIACIDPVTMPNIRGLLTVVTGLTPQAVFIATLVSSTLLLLLTVHQAKTFPKPYDVLAICMCFVALVSFHTNVYDLSILLLPIVLLLGAENRPKQFRWIVMPPIVLLFCSPLVALRAVRPGLLAAAVGWLWLGLTYTIKQREASALRVPGQAGRREFPSVSPAPARG